MKRMKRVESAKTTWRIFGWPRLLVIWFAFSLAGLLGASLGEYHLHQSFRVPFAWFLLTGGGAVVAVGTMLLATYTAEREGDGP